MKGTLVTLQTIREHQKRKAWQDLVEAERQRQEQEAKVAALRQAAEEARAAEEEEAGWLAQRQKWCMQLELHQRRENERLSAHAAAVERQRAALETARQEVRVIELVIERAEEAEALEARRAETKQNDEISTQRWWRKCS